MIGAPPLRVAWTFASKPSQTCPLPHRAGGFTHRKRSSYFSPRPHEVGERGKFAMSLSQSRCIYMLACPMNGRARRPRRERDASPRPVRAAEGKRFPATRRGAEFRSTGASRRKRRARRAPVSRAGRRHIRGSRRPGGWCSSRRRTRRARRGSRDSAPRSI